MRGLHRHLLHLGRFGAERRRTRKSRKVRPGGETRSKKLNHVRISKDEGAGFIYVQVI